MPLTVLLSGNGVRKHGGGKRYAPRIRAPRTQDPAQIQRVERARYAQEEARFRRYLQRQWRGFEAGEVPITALYQGFSRELYRFQVRMYVMGRRSVGDFRNTLSEEEMRFLHGQHAQEMKYFNGFLRDFMAGKGRMPYAQRLDLYALGGYSLYLRGAVLNAPGAATARWWWRTNPEAEHCEDCIRIEEECRRRGGFTLREILEEFGTPGERTRCGNRCRCGLHMDGSAGQPAGPRLPRTRPTAYRKKKKKDGTHETRSQEEPRRRILAAPGARGAR